MKKDWIHFGRRPSGNKQIKNVKNALAYFFKEMTRSQSAIRNALK
jgi:hypothetical protein